MGNTTSTTSPSTSPSPPFTEEPSREDNETVEGEAGSPVGSPVASPPSPQGRPVSLHLSSPIPTRTAFKYGNDLASSSADQLAPIISVFISPPPISTGDETPVFSGHATTSSPSPPPSPRSQISGASSVSSVGSKITSFFWNAQEQFYTGKVARRQSQLESAGRLGRPCCFTLQSITLEGNFPATAQVQAEVIVLFDKTHPYLDSISELPPLRTLPRPALRRGQVNIGGRTDLILLPSVTSSSILSITVLLDGAPIGNARYPFSEITATLRPTELRLTPAGAGGDKSPRSRSPSSPCSSPLRRHILSSSPSRSSYRRNEGTESMGSGLESLRVRTPSPSPSLPSRTSSRQAAIGGERGEAEPAGEAGPPTLQAVWGEVVFYDNRSSGVGWVGLMKEGGELINEQRLLVVTPQSFSLMKSPHCVLGQEGYSMTQVRRVEPKGPPHIPPPEQADGMDRNTSTRNDTTVTTTSPSTTTTSSSSSSDNRPSRGGRGGGGGGAMVTISVSCAEEGEQDILLAVDSEEDARRWTQLMKRAAHEAAFGEPEMR